jgi:hypothetical protein
MKRIFTGVVASAILVSSVAATPRWNGPGWYQVNEVSQQGRVLFSLLYLGPYASQEDCIAVLHMDYTDPGETADEDMFNDYSCVNLAAQPDWDN